MKLSLGTVILLLATAACEEGTNTPLTPATDSGAHDATADAESTAKDGGGTGEEAGGEAGACKLTGTTGVPACDQCQQAKCCEKISTCLSNADCAALFACTNGCVDGQTKDGGTFDAAADGAVDDCWNNCESAYSANVVTVFEAQDSCVSTSCATQCN